MSKKRKNEANLPAVSKQTAGGVTGAVVGGMVAGPVGAVAGGIAGALLGNSSAKGEKPMKHAMESIRSAGRRGAKAIKSARDRKTLTEQPSKGSAAKKVALKSARTKQKQAVPPTKTKKAASQSARKPTKKKA